MHKAGLLKQLSCQGHAISTIALQVTALEKLQQSQEAPTVSA
jgi:hypothetical protein